MPVRRPAVDGKIGDIILMYSRRNASPQTRQIEGRGEAVVCMRVYDIDALCCLTGSRVTRVCADAVSEVLTERRVAVTILAMLQFTNGTIASLETSWGLPIG